MGYSQAYSLVFRSWATETPLVQAKVHVVEVGLGVDKVFFTPFSGLLRGLPSLSKGSVLGLAVFVRRVSLKRRVKCVF